jgi:hypothetical protein
VVARRAREGMDVSRFSRGWFPATGNARQLHRIIQVLLGHKKLDTPALYTGVAISALGQVTSPLDFLLKTPG